MSGKQNSKKQIESQHRDAMSYSTPKDPYKAIFAIRERFQEDIFQTRGMGCAVKVGDSVRLVTWHGVIGEDDYNKSVIMDRFSDKSTKDFLSSRNRYRLEMSIVKEIGSNFTFLSVDAGGANFTTTLELVPQNNLKASDLTAYSFSGKEKLELKFEYDKDKQKHILRSDNWKNRIILEKSSVVGSPIMVDDGTNNRRVVVGVVGEIGGELSPCFITEKECNGK